MNVEFTDNFIKSIDKISQPSIKNKLKQLVVIFENSNSLKEIPNIKKIVGYQHFYRLRVGKYRLGFEYKNSTVTFLAIAHRSRIYKIFP